MKYQYNAFFLFRLPDIIIFLLSVIILFTILMIFFILEIS